MLEADGIARAQKLAGFALSQAQVSPPEHELTPFQSPGPTRSHGLEGSGLPCLPPSPSHSETGSAL